MKGLVLTAPNDDSEDLEIRRVPHDDVEAYEVCGWTVDHDALKDTNHGRYSVLMWRAIG